MSRTLDEAIRHEMNIAEKQEELAKVCIAKRAKDDCLKCAEEHRQLAEWLKELAERRKQIKSCKGCKWLRLPDGCANDRCARMYKDRYEAERRTDGQE